MSANVTTTAFFGMANQDEFTDDIYDKYIKDLHKQRKTIHVPRPPQIVIKKLETQRS